MKIQVDKLDLDKLAPLPVDLKTLSDVVEKKVVNKNVYDEFVKKVNAIDTSGLVNKTDYNAKIKDIEDKIPSIANIATAVAFTTVENKIPNVSNLVKKVDYVEKIKEIEGKYFTTSHYNKSTNNILGTKIKNKKIS